MGLIYSTSLQTSLRQLFDLSKLYEKSSTGPAARVCPCPRMFFPFHFYFLSLFIFLFPFLLFVPFLYFIYSIDIYSPSFVGYVYYFPSLFCFFVPLCLLSFRTFAIFHRHFPPLGYDLIILWYYLIETFLTYLLLDSPLRAWITGSWPNYGILVWPLAFPR